jgi:hypothetical protein
MDSDIHSNVYEITDVTDVQGMWSSIIGTARFIYGSVSDTPTPTPTPTDTPTDTPTPTPVCYNNTHPVCSGNGVCIATDTCQCYSPKFIGYKCEINMTVTNVGAIVGGVIGGVIGLCLLITVIAVIVTLVLIFRRKHVNTKSEVPENHDVDIERPAILHEPVQIDQVEIEIDQEKPLEAEVVQEQSVEQEQVIIQSLPAEEEVSLAVEKELGEISQDMA